MKYLFIIIALFISSFAFAGTDTNPTETKNETIEVADENKDVASEDESEYEIIYELFEDIRLEETYETNVMA